MHVIIGSRKSHLAQFQAKSVKKKLESLGHTCDLVLKESLGDLNLDVDLEKTESKGFFTSDFKEMLINKKVDCVVHSWKDLPIEDGTETKIIATLDREDSRDVLFIKKSCVSKKKWMVLSSSPRRKFNIKNFFDYLSDGDVETEFKSIRGNIPTRFSKFLNDSEADGFCVALAAVKRLLKEDTFQKDHPQVWQDLQDNCKWSVLPESLCPSAAAQGALAVEILKERPELEDVFKSINNESNFVEIQKERETLSAHGGGCHLAVGATVFNKAYGELSFSAGDVNSVTFFSKEFKPLKKYPDQINEDQLWISSRQAKSQRTKHHEIKIPEGKKSYLVTREESFNQRFLTSEKDLVFTSGLRTWKKLFSKGVWVSGSLDSLGSSEYIFDLFPSAGKTKHIWLTRDGVNGPEEFETKQTYSVFSAVEESSFEGKECFAWMSGRLMIEELKKHPVLRNKKHFLGMGRSIEYVKSHISEINFGKDFNFYPFYDLEQLKQDLIRR